MAQLTATAGRGDWRPPLGFADRLAVIGATGSGKSELCRHVFSSLRCRRVLVDPKADWQVRGAPLVELVESDSGELRGDWQQRLASVDWWAPIVHVRPPWLGRSSDADVRAALEALYRAVDTRPGALHVWTDEGYAVSSASWSPRGLTNLQVAGRGAGHGHTVAMQRPVNVAGELVSEATHIAVFAHSLEDIDLAQVAHAATWLPHALGRPSRNGALGVLRDVLERLPWHAFVWLDRRRQVAAVADPLPAVWRRGGPVERRRVNLG